MIRRWLARRRERALPYFERGEPAPCRCPCHSNPGMVHAMPCCAPCGKCGVVFASGRSKHESSCPGRT